MKLERMHNESRSHNMMLLVAHRQDSGGSAEAAQRAAAVAQ